MVDAGVVPVAAVGPGDRDGPDAAARIGVPVGTADVDPLVELVPRCCAGRSPEVIGPFTGQISPWPPRP